MSRPVVHLNGLRTRLFLAHVVVVLVGSLTLYAAASVTAPRFFENHIGHMHAPGAGSMGMGPRAMPDETAALDQALLDAFRSALNQALAVAGVAALLAGLGTSVFAADRIARPVGRLALAARRIASGHYAERVPAIAGDEVGALAASFNEMAEALECTERRRTELIGDVAHELRTPLSTLSGYLEGLLDGVIEPIPETWTLLHGETRRLERLVEDLHELSRAEAGQLSLVPALVAPNEVVAATVGRFAPEYAAKGVRLEIEADERVPAVSADRDRLVQVLTNLLGNALRHTPAGGSVTVRVRPQDPVVRFTVEDTGAGVAAEHLPHLFERFYRIDKSRSRALGGTGVGLTIAKALLEAMGGEIWAASDGLGRGTTLGFTLPIAPLRRG